MERHPHPPQPGLHGLRGLAAQLLGNAAANVAVGARNV